MVSRVLRAIGLLAVLALIAGSFGALTLVKSRLHITVEEEESAARRGPDPVAVLAEDVAAMRAELSALREGMVSGMQALHDALDASRSAPAPVEASSPTQGFLHFKLPTDGFAFDRRQRFTVLPSLSRVGFDARSTLHDFSGVTTSVEGEFTANLARPDQDCRGSVRAQAASLDTGVADRDEDMRALLGTETYPEIGFEWSTFEPTRIDAASQQVEGVARGTLTIHGTAREIAMPVSVSVDASKRLAIEGETKIRLSDYALEPPSKLGVISVDDELTLWIALRARTLGPAQEGAQ